MSTTFDMYSFLKKLCSLGMRQGPQEVAARVLIEQMLMEHNIDFIVQEFDTAIPIARRSELTIDGGIEIKAIATSFVSGEITDKGALMSNMMSSQPFFYSSNINFNPFCDVISRANHYGAPALAISKKDVPTVLEAKSIYGVVEVEPYCFASANIFVGNNIDPQIVLIAHYDSIGPGAVDNGSGIVTLLSCALKMNLDRTCIIFCGNEELSYDETVYWGRGYRDLEQKNKKLFDKAKAIYVIDSIGCGSVNIEQNPALTKLAFPIKKIDLYSDKIFTISSNYMDVMRTYHSDADIPEELHVADIEDTVQFLLESEKKFG